jgi:protein-S-isoprenylcysteine O-methyltransferase Ste14
MAFLTWFISLRGKRYHGFFRFFSFESITLLILLVYKDWFNNPFSWHQILSWIFLTASLLVAVFGFKRYYGTGKPSDGMEQTTRLIDEGLFAYIRHPLYLSLILGGMGVMLKHPGWLEVLLSCINIIALYATAKVEEKEMIISFGAGYDEYMKKTRMFIPYIF